MAEASRLCCPNHSGGTPLPLSTETLTGQGAHEARPYVLIVCFDQKTQAALTRIWGENSDSANGAPTSQPGATPQEIVSVNV